MVNHNPDLELVREVVDEISNALQIVAPLAEHMRRQSAGAMRTALDLEDGVERLVMAIRRLQPPSSE